MRCFAVSALLIVSTPMTKGACPNGCSGHGTCGEFDACVCHSNWIGADCSERQCLSGTSWIATARGDLNFDGDTNDATVHQPDVRFSSTSLNYVRTQAHPGGDWESWPSTFDPIGEAHFAMECSNRGLCGRETGECSCFEGFTGAGCRRTVCPDGCSGHGQCKSVRQQSGAFSYDLWDADMSRSCLCDPGFDGPSCANRKCPVGDDPLTVDDQHETQWIDVYLSTGASFSGTVTLAYVDNNGEKWVTAPFAVAPFPGIDTGTATAAQAALRALPHDMLGSVTVVEGHCAASIPGTSQFSAAGTFEAGSTVGFTRNFVDGDAFNCPSAASDEVYVFNSAGITLADGTSASATIEDNLACNLLKASYCIRLEVAFGGPGNTGDVSPLTVDTSRVQIASGESDANELNTFTTMVDVTSTLNIAVSESTGGVSATYVTKATHDKSCTAGSCSITSSTKNIVLDGGGDAFGTSVYDRVNVWCGSSKLLGTFTVASASTVSIVTAEVIPDCPGSIGNEVIVKRVSDFIQVNADLSALLGIGARVSLTEAGTYFGSTPSREVLAVYGAFGVSIIYLDNRETETDRLDFHTSDIGPTTPGTSTRFEIYGSGTSERAPCSDRGVCNDKTGECVCFAGYTGYSCNLQNNLAV